MRASELSNSSSGSSKPANGCPGVIKADELYTLTEFKRRVGLGDSALRKARRRGLPVYREGGRAFVFGRDWIKYVTQTHGRDDAQGGGHV
jgi:hypothetical protein